MTVFLLTLFLHTPHAPLIIDAYATWDRCMAEREKYVNIPRTFPLCQILRIKETP